MKQKRKPAWLKVDWDNVIDIEEEDIVKPKENKSRLNEFIMKIVSFTTDTMRFTTTLSEKISPANFSLIITFILFSFVLWTTRDSKEQKKKLE